MFLENIDSLGMLNHLQDAVIDENKKKLSQSSANQYNFDKLKMYFGEDHIYKGIIMSMPTVGDILDVGESIFYHAFSSFLYNSTSIRVVLWDNGIDWNKFKDIEVFNLLIHTIKNKSPLDLVFKNIRFDDFELVPAKRKIEDDEYNEIALYSESQDILLYEEDYMYIAEYIREMLNIHPKVEKAKGKTAKSWIIQEDKMNLSIEDEHSTYSLLPKISACVNHPGFKYKLQELKEVGIYQFMDSVKRLQKYESSTAALKGVFSGFVSAKDFQEETLNFMSDL